jgi:ABC-2 type transport system ATP-binding protein
VDTPENLRTKLYGRKVVFHLAEMNTAWSVALRALPFVQDVQSVDNRLVISLPDPEGQNPLIIRRLVELGAEIQFVGELRHSLEDIYLQTIQGEGV